MSFTKAFSKVSFSEAFAVGHDADFLFGGVGHFLEEIERKKQLAAITRKIPGPIDRRTVPRFAPFPAVQPMPKAEPGVDMAAIKQQRQAEAALVAAQRRRRDEEAVLLLAS